MAQVDVSGGRDPVHPCLKGRTGGHRPVDVMDDDAFGVDEDRLRQRRRGTDVLQHDPVGIRPDREVDTDLLGERLAAGGVVLVDPDEVELYAVCLLGTRETRARAGISASHGAHHEAKNVITTGVPIELPSFGSATGDPPSSAGSVAGSLMLGVDLPPKPNRPSAKQTRENAPDSQVCESTAHPGIRGDGSPRRRPSQRRAASGR